MSEEENPNMEIWEALRSAKPEFVKKMGHKGGLNSIDPQYRIEKMTRLFGPYGDTWGMDEYATEIVRDEKTRPVLIMMKASFWYTLKGKRISFPIYSSRPMAGKLEDLLKCLETSTLCKAMSRIGVCADVYMGAFDGDEYADSGKGEEEAKPHPSVPSGAEQPPPQKTTAVDPENPPAQHIDKQIPVVPLPEGWEAEPVGFGRHKGMTWKQMAEGGPDGQRAGWLEWFVGQDPRVDREGRVISSHKWLQDKLERYSKAVHCLEIIRTREGLGPDELAYGEVDDYDRPLDPEESPF